MPGNSKSTSAYDLVEDKSQGTTFHLTGMNHSDKDAPFHLAGWILFLACAFLFLYIAIRDNDVILALASLIFLTGCIAFLIPLLKKDRKGTKLPSGDEPPKSDGK